MYYGHHALVRGLASLHLLGPSATAVVVSSDAMRFGGFDNSLETGSGARGSREAAGRPGGGEQAAHLECLLEPGDLGVLRRAAPHRMVGRRGRRLSLKNCGADGAASRKYIALQTVTVQC